MANAKNTSSAVSEFKKLKNSLLRSEKNQYGRFTFRSEIKAYEFAALAEEAGENPSQVKLDQSRGMTGKYEFPWYVEL
jgi:hypothetical protein